MKKKEKQKEITQKEDKEKNKIEEIRKDNTTKIIRIR